MPYVSLTRVAVLAVALACSLPVGAGAQSAQSGGWDRDILTSQRALIIDQSSAMSIGAQVRDPTGSEGEGAYVTTVTQDGPAAKAGLREGDVIVEFDGERVRGASQLTRLVRETPANRTVKVVVQRSGKRQELTITVAKSRPFSLEIPDLLQGRGTRLEPPILRWRWPDDQQSLPTPGQPFNPRFAPPLWFYSGAARLGVTVQDVTQQLADYFGASQGGVLVSGIVSGGPAAKSGLRAGDVITAIDNQPVHDIAGLRRMLAEKRAGDQVSVAIVRDRRPQTVKVVLEEEKRSV